MKRGSFDERVAKCISQFREVEERSRELGERQGVRMQDRWSDKLKGVSRKA
jgi:hypothetical protein